MNINEWIKKKRIINNQNVIIDSIKYLYTIYILFIYYL